MNVRPKVLCGVTGSVMVGICVVLITTRREPQFTTSLIDVGLVTDGANTCISASVMNKGRSALILDGIRYEWRDQTGQIHGASAFSDWNHTFPPGATERTTFLIPRDAETVRIWVIYDSWSSLQRKMRSTCLNLASKPLAARFPRLRVWLLEVGFSHPSRRLPSPWMTYRGRKVGRSGPVDTPRFALILPVL